MSLEYISVESREQRKYLEIMAGEIWREHYTPIIGPDQVEYMLQLFQSEEAMDRQIRKEGYRYYMVYTDKNPCGYSAIQPRKEEKALFISKLYLHQDYRGRGLARKIIEWLSQRAQELKLQKLLLYVHKHNSSLKFYEKTGFKIVEPVVTDIGEGFYMDDYRMELEL